MLQQNIRNFSFLMSTSADELRLLSPLPEYFHTVLPAGAPSYGPPCWSTVIYPPYWSTLSVNDQLDKI